MRYGLIGAGPVSQYLVGKLPSLPQELGPVAATNHRSASRIVNTLRAGEARGVNGLNEVQTLLICSPRDHLASVLAILEKSALQWNERSIVLCDCRVFSRELEHFRKSGAQVASIQPVAGMPGRLLIEGDKDALKVARHLVRELRAVALEIRPDEYQLYCAAMTMGSSLFTPLLDGFLLSIGRTGVSGNVPLQILEAVFQHSLRAFLYSGRKSWAGTVGRQNRGMMQGEIEALEALHPELAELYRASAEASIRFLTTKVPPKNQRRTPQQIT